MDKNENRIKTPSAHKKKLDVISARPEHSP
jgi:hypothetical protein